MYHINQRYAQVLTVAAAAKTIALYIAAVAVCLCHLAIDLGKACAPARPHIRRAAIHTYNAGRRVRRYIDAQEVRLNDAIFTPSNTPTKETPSETAAPEIESLTEVETVFWTAAAATFCLAPVYTPVHSAPAEPAIFPTADSPAANYTISQLKDLARAASLPRYSTMNKQSLLEALHLI